MKAALFALGVLTAGLTATGTAAQTYLDDRSSPSALVRSLYNAINRGEYARAYGYFATPPADSLEAYAEGYADTESVEVMTGAALEEGATGSVYYTLPVAIRSTDSGGAERVFAGCYTLRLADPHIQDAPFTPLGIEEGDLAEADGPLADALPASCGEASADQQADADPLLDEAKAAFEERYRDSCPVPRTDAAAAPDEPRSHTIEFNYGHDARDAPRREARLFRFPCLSGAYNRAYVFFLADDEGGVRPLHFAVPDVSVIHEDDDREQVGYVRITGYETRDRLFNAEYDPEAHTIAANELWRGLADASARGLWLFREGRFALVRYEVDASYDGEANPTTVLDYFTGP